MRLMLACALMAVQNPPPEWRSVQDLSLPGAGLRRVELPVATLDSARPGLEDLRILDDAGRELPWSLERPPTAPGPRRPAKAKSFLRGDVTETAIETGIDAPLAAVELEIAASEFLKSASVEGSVDGRTWTPLRADEPLFARPGQGRRERIDLDPAPWPFLRVMLDDRRSAPVAVTGAWLRPVPPESSPPAAVDIHISFREEEAGRTRLGLRFPGRHVRLAEVSVETPERAFSRRATLSARRIVDGQEREEPLAEGTLFRLSVDGRPSTSRLRLAAEVRLPEAEAILTIHHGDSPPLEVPVVRATARPVRVRVAVPRAGEYRLISGNPSASAPRYDLNGLEGQGSEEAPEVPGPIRRNPSWLPPEALPGVVAVGAPIDVGAWRLRKEVRLSAAAVHELELDPDVLGAMEPSGADVRLVRDGRQVPYLDDGVGRLKSLAPRVARSDDPDRRTPSRWVLELPREGLPMRAVTCTASESLFEREVRVWEDLRDEVGARRRVSLGSTRWSRTPGSGDVRLRIELTRVPSGRRLVVEVENGDNLPLEIRDFEVTYRARRLLFKAEAGRELWLHYGNREASAPAYDLALIGNELRAAAKGKAELGPEEGAPPVPPSEEPTAVATALLWGALVVVTLALLVVLAKVVPKTTP